MSMEENMQTLETEMDMDMETPVDMEGSDMDEAVEDAWEEETPHAQQQESDGQEPELFTLKNRDETRQVTRDELIAMAQKGWDYDNVRQERDQLRQYRQAMERVGAPIQAVPRAETLMQRVKANARQQDLDRFVHAYPGVKAEDIPQEVWGQVAGGVPLVSAYAMHENRQLRLALAAQAQSERNRARTPGGLGGSFGAEFDELERMWNEED